MADRRPRWDPTPTFIWRDEADLARQYKRYAAELDEWDAEWHLTDLRRMDPELAKLAQQRRDAAVESEVETFRAFLDQARPEDFRSE